MTGYSKPLPIFFQGFHSLFAINKRTRDRGLQSSTPVLNSWTAFSRVQPEPGPQEERSCAASPVRW